MFRAIFTGIILCILLSNCTKDHTQGNTCTTCPNTVSFSKTIIPVFEQSCAINGGSCHAGSNAVSNRLNLNADTAYEQVTQYGLGIVDTAHPTNSLLYSYLVYPTGTVQHMPLDEPSLPQCTIQEILCWIQQGAPDN